ncbi:MULTISPECIES: phosphotriesterase family protein [Cytobacillus]|uniref:phosphotriesterase family protein n=1 Tax=Cytobacillus TaxID=2675230 RepID=UPI002040B09C|nr:phosphotriesterase [Cytobacillus firmus]MCM3707323.1 phosphotriesterase [Cytobacillus firmus]
MIQTVLGKIDPEKLGICSAHEHLSIDLSRVKKDPDTILDDEQGMCEELGDFYRLGGRSMVEVTNDGMGRDASLLKRLSEATGVHLITCTGFYKDPYIPDFADGWKAEQFAQHFIKEATEGIGDTGILPGVIGEVGTSKNEMKPIERDLLIGAAMAGIETGLPVTTHTTLGTLGLEQVGLLTKHGLPADQIIIGHQDLNPNKDEVLAVLETGAYIAFDTIGKNNYRPDEERADFLLDFINRGYEKQILLSADLTRKSHWKKNGGPGYGLVLETFIPKLKKFGVPEIILHQFLTVNPSRAFSIRERS